MSHQYGGPWTEIKLDVLRSYLNFYTDALKNQQFEKWYIDAFAGTGERNEIRNIDADLFQAGGTEEQTFDGSAKIALQVARPFDRYYFIEHDSERHAELQRLQAQFPAAQIHCHCGDANSILPPLIEELMQRSRRAVVFLDPYGLNLDWQTLVFLAKTQRVDVAYLVGIAGMLRQAAHDKSKIEPYKIERLNRTWGDAQWLEDLYLQKPAGQRDLFDHKPGATTERCSPKDAEAWAAKKLKSAGFVAVSKPLRLPPTGIHKFSLFFAASNPKGAPIAMRAANHIIDKGN